MHKNTLKMTCSVFINGNFICPKEKISDLLCEDHSKLKMILSDTCNICLDKMEENLFIECGHSFHKKCISEWLKTKTTCPCCRKKVKTTNFIQSEQNHLNLERIVLNSNFIYWINQMMNTYVQDLVGVSFHDMLFVINQPQHYYYLTNVYTNELNNISINLFELELKLNEIADFVRVDPLNIVYESDSDNDSNEYQEYSEELDNSDLIDINQLEFVSFDYD